MTVRNRYSVIAVLTSCMLVGCIVVPVPVPPRGDIYTSEIKLEILVGSRATKTQVIDRLGKPVKYRKTSMSYRACRKPFGVGWLIGFYDRPVYVRPEGVPSNVMAECFELVLNFDQDGHLTGYQERPWPPDVNFLQEDMTLNKFADEGDPVAAQLWLQAAPKTSVPALETRKEAGIYCANADLGHADAQIRIAILYDQGAYGTKVDLVRAWVWYSLAAQNGDEAAKTRISSLTDELTQEQLDEAKRQLAVWKPGQCKQELTPDAKETEDQLRKKFLPPPDGQSALYIYRDSQLSAALSKLIYVDGQRLGETAPMTYFYIVVPPGKHKIATEPEFGIIRELIVNTESERNYFIRQYEKVGFFRSSATLELVPAEEGKKAVSRCELAR